MSRGLGRSRHKAKLNSRGKQGGVRAAKGTFSTSRSELRTATAGFEMWHFHQKVCGLKHSREGKHGANKVGGKVQAQPGLAPVELKKPWE